MFISVVPNRNSNPTILLRETYREDGKVKNRTLANLTQWSPEKLAALAAALDSARSDGPPVGEKWSEPFPMAMSTPCWAPLGA